MTRKQIDLDETIARLVDYWGADEILDSLAQRLREASYESPEPLATKQFTAASLTESALCDIRINWRTQEREAADAR